MLIEYRKADSERVHLATERRHPRTANKGFGAHGVLEEFDERQLSHETYIVVTYLCHQIYVEGVEVKVLRDRTLLASIAATQ